MSNSTLCDGDFCAWANERAALLRFRRPAEADIEHVADELESMRTSEKRELVNRLTVLLLHLLKWEFRPALRDHSRRNSIRVQRIGVASLVRDNPSLKSALGAAIRSPSGCQDSGRERDRLRGAILPAVCPWSFEQMMADAFWPGAVF